MSLVYITYHDENIGEFDRDLHDDVVHHRHYQSKFQKKVREQERRPHIIEAPDGKKLVTSSMKCKHATMGEAHTTLKSPSEFLKKQGGVQWSHVREHTCPPPRYIPPLPQCARSKAIIDNNTEEECVRKRYFKNHKHRVNFVKLNIEANKKSTALPPAPHYVDSVHGDRHRLLPSGLVPVNICGKNFGKVPHYLKINNKMLAKVRTQCRREEKLTSANHPLTLIKPLAAAEKLERYMARQGLFKLSNEERSELLVGLRSNFDKLFKTYQALPLYTDTMAKKLRKGKLEKDMRQLEQDIFLLDANPTIYISQF